MKSGGKPAPWEELRHLRDKVRDLSSLIEVSIIINSTVELEKLIGLVMEKAQAVMKAEASSVMLFNENTHLLECEVALGEVGEQVRKTVQLKLGEGVAGWVAQQRQALIVPDVTQDPRFTPKVDQATGFQTRSILAAPLLVKDKLIGVAEVINRQDGQAFDQDDLELFSTFCRQVAMAIENVRMYRVELEKQKLEQQLEAAKFIQQSFMPEAFPVCEDGRFAVFAKSLPARSIGGDLFDCIAFENGEIGVAVGDVTGKGIPAALYMARLVSDFRTYAQRYRRPARVLQALNSALVERSRRGMFVTFVYGVLGPESGVFRYANAGHLPPIQVADGHAAELVEHEAAPPLGIGAMEHVPENQLRLKAGGRLVLITDGIIEAKSREDTLYSLQRVQRFLAQPYESVQVLTEKLINDVQGFARGTEQFDDLTVLALQWR